MCAHFVSFTALSVRQVAITCVILFIYFAVCLHVHDNERLKNFNRILLLALNLGDRIAYVPLFRLSATYVLCVEHVSFLETDSCTLS